MNPLTQVRNQRLMTEKELQLGTANTSSSWHAMFKDSAWIYIGGLDYELTEGDVICVFSQYGEVVNINLVRDQATGKSKGFAFLCYEDQRSTVLACDNLNGAKVVGRTLRVNHVESYKVKELTKPFDDPIRQQLRERGCAPGTDVGSSPAATADLSPARQPRSRDRQSDRPSGGSTTGNSERVKREKIDPGYPDYQPAASNRRSRSRSPSRTSSQRNRYQLVSSASASSRRRHQRSRSRSCSPRRRSGR